METTNFEAIAERIISESRVNVINVRWLAGTVIVFLSITLTFFAISTAAYFDLQSNDMAIREELRAGFARVEAAQREHDAQYRHKERKD